MGFLTILSRYTDQLRDPLMVVTLKDAAQPIWSLSTLAAQLNLGLGRALQTIGLCRTLVSGAQH
jgi:hypothetical protein